ncbi:winged helix DNA-binding domain-containing protein [Streptomyces sp. NPDC051561]|uniref:winged helix DNA-binding domain-containing protein n=1 Tax=Streptomyces sp. NPDC051561 TaxID=3365658 RepID=UPI0037A178EF
MTTTDGRRSASAPLLSARALGRATLARQLLLTRSGLTAREAVHHLVGLQAQNTKPPYVSLAARLEGFDPHELSALMASHEVGRMVTMRSTLHTLTGEDCLNLRLLVQPVIDRELKIFLGRLGGVVDGNEVAALARELVEERPLSLKELREGLLKRWPDSNPQELATVARCAVPLVQATPRGLWGESGQVALTTARSWFDRPEPDLAPAEVDGLLDATVLRYLGAFGPASVKDMQVWCGRTRLRTAFDRLRPRLVTFRDEHGTELFDLPDAPRPDEDTPAPVRFLPEYDNLLLSHADRTRVAPPEYAARTWYVNTSYSTFLVDGLLAGIWRAGESAKDGTAWITVEPFGKLTRAQRTEVVEEATRTLSVLSPGRAHDVRFGEFYGTRAT